MNGWFPKINRDGQIASGNKGIWLDGKQVSDYGTSPFWLGTTLCYNRNDNTTQIGEEILPIAYNEYYGSERDEWTGFANGHVDFYKGLVKTNEADGLTLAKYAGYGSVYGFNLAYVAPYQSEDRTLVYNNIPIYQGKITNYQMSLNGIIAWQVAISTYGRQILTQGGSISIRTDENPKIIFDYLGQSWIVSQTNIGTIIYPFLSHYGYYISGDLYYLDARVLGNKLLVVGSDSAGNLLKRDIDFSLPRVDLRNI